MSDSNNSDVKNMNNSINIKNENGSLMLKQLDKNK
jgi:hypothetical protein